MSEENDNLQNKSFPEYERVLTEFRDLLEKQETKKKDTIKRLAILLEKEGCPIEMISEKIIDDLAGYATKQYVNQCLDKKYKKKVIVNQETSFTDDDKKVSEQSTNPPLIDTSGNVVNDENESLEPRKLDVEPKRIYQELQEKDNELNQAKAELATTTQQLNELQQKQEPRPVEINQQIEIKMDRGNLLAMIEVNRKQFEKAKSAGDLDLAEKIKKEMIYYWTYDLEAKKLLKLEVEY